MNIPNIKPMKIKKTILADTAKRYQYILDELNIGSKANKRMKNSIPLLIHCILFSFLFNSFIFFYLIKLNILFFICKDTNFFQTFLFELIYIDNYMVILNQSAFFVS
jgi:hypothetical protein